MGILRHLLAVALFAAVHMTQAQDDPATGAAVVQTVDALMPPLPEGAAGSGQADQYLCTSVPLPDTPLKLNSIVPKPGPGVTHMLLFGCKTAASERRTWDCFMRSPCARGREEVLYGWASDSDGHRLPDGVAYSVGPGTGILDVVLQVRYTAGRPAEDRSGFTLNVGAEPLPLAAGMLTFASLFTLPPKEPAFKVENSCCYAGLEPLTAHALRVHTHALGRSVMVHRAGPGGDGVLARRDPQQPKGFSGLDPPVVLHPGDRITTTCTFDTTSREADTVSGATREDEMCNAYMMVYSEMPYYMVCGNERAMVRHDGSGGIPSGAALVPENADTWAAPAPIGMSQNDGHHLGQIVGVARGANDTLWVLHRGRRVWDGSTFFGGGRAEHITDATPIRGPTVLQLRADTGEVVQAWGDGALIMPHGLGIDPDGNVWVTDAGRHQAVKFSPDGRELTAIGLRAKPGHDLTHLCKPSAVAFNANGDVFVADGYCNRRVMQYTADGTFIRSYTMANGRLALPHSVAVDDCASALYVADLEGRAVRRFSTAGADAGKLTGSWDVTGYGKPYAVTPGPYGSLLALCWSAVGGYGTILHLDPSGSGVMDSWRLDGVAGPHDLAVAPAPLAATGAGDRTLALFVAEAAKNADNHVHKLIVLHPNTPMGGRSADTEEPTVAAEIALPDPAELQAADAAAAETQRAAADIERAAGQIAAAAAELLDAVKTGPRQDNPDAAAAASLIAQSAVLIDDQLAAMSANQRSGDGSDAGVRAPSGGAWPAGQWAAQRQAEARGGLEYLLTVGAPAGVIMLFALVAFALGRQVQRMTTVPEFQPLPMKEPPPSPPGRHDVMMRSTFGRSDSFGSAFTTQNSFAAPRGMKDDPAEVVVHRQEDMTRPPSSTGSVRRTSAAAASLGEVRRAAALAEAQRELSAPTPLELTTSAAAREKTALLRQALTNKGISKGPGSIRRASADTRSTRLMDVGVSLEALVGMRGQQGNGWAAGGNGGGGSTGKKSDPSVRGEVACAARDVEMSQQTPRGAATMPPPASPPQSVFTGADGGSLGSSADAVQVRAPVQKPSTRRFSAADTGRGSVVSPVLSIIDEAVSVQQIRDIVQGIKGNGASGPPTGSGSGSPLRRSSASVNSALLPLPVLERKDS